MTRIPVALAATLAMALPFSAAHADSNDIKGTRLSISSQGEVTRAPDIATVSAGVTTQSATAAVAMQDNARSMSAVISALKKAGIADKDIRTTGIDLSPQYRYQENQAPTLVGYRASNNVSVTFRDISQTGKVIDTLVSQGANQINGPNFSVEKADAALDEARASAITQARKRADLYARATGMRVKRIISINESGHYANPAPLRLERAMAAKAPAAADTMVQPGESTLQVNVNVEFELE